MSELTKMLETSLREGLQMVPFSKWMGMELIAIEDNLVIMELEMKDALVGNPIRGALHGGVVSAILDTVGGFAALLGVLTHEKNGSNAADISPWLSTIDMRTDYLRPGVGKRFTATAFPQRVGRRVVVTRMELHNENDEHVAVGTGTYVVP